MLIPDFHRQGADRWAAYGNHSHLIDPAMIPECRQTQARLTN
jgi:hypothetical protein